MFLNDTDLESWEQHTGEYLSSDGKWYNNKDEESKNKGDDILC